MANLLDHRLGSFSLKTSDLIRSDAVEVSQKMQIGLSLYV